MNQSLAHEQNDVARFGDAWNTFWFKRSPSHILGLLRFLAGLCSLLYLALWSVDLERFLSNDGLLPAAVVSEAVSNDPLYYPWRFSLMDYLPNRAALWSFHFASLAAAALCMLGIASRWTTILTLISVLSYVHRAPLLMTPAEPLLVWSLLYLCLAPCGQWCSLDRLWSKSTVELADSVAANIALRLMQIHLSMHYLFVATTQLSDRAWWSGNAVWILMAQSRTRGVDLTMLRESTFLLNGLTHLLVLLAFALALGPWNRFLRPIVNWLVIPYALLIALLTGLWIYAIVLAALQVVFCDPKSLARRFERFTSSGAG
jgi:hypothetical protein